MAKRSAGIQIFTDGGCNPNPGPGGWGAVIIRQGKKIKELSGAEKETTNNRMELTAAVQALHFFKESENLELHTDSQYLQKGITEWLPRWVSRGWRTAGGGDVKNADLWQALALEVERHCVTWKWVKGHAGHRWNERADALATAAMGLPALPLEDFGAVHLFTAAVYSGASGMGSWAVLLQYHDREKIASGMERDTSANRMHLVAAMNGLKALRRKVRVHVYTTSSYVRDGVTRWVKGWEMRDWKTQEGKPVLHRELWESIVRLARDHDTHWHVVNRDARPEGMLRAKSLAKETANAQ